MASLVKLCKIIKPLASRKTGVFYNAVRPKVYTHADFKPGPYPKTEEERKKAAEKYGLHPDEYEPYPDDGDGVGDYPKLPLLGTATRDPFYPYDDPALKRNYHEVFHRDANMLGEDRWDAGVKPPVSYGFAYAMFFGAVSTIAILAFVFEATKNTNHHPVMEKQMPKPGTVHYTFEPAH